MLSGLIEIFCCVFCSTKNVRFCPAETEEPFEICALTKLPPASIRSAIPSLILITFPVKVSPANIFCNKAFPADVFGCAFCILLGILGVALLVCEFLSTELPALLVN